MLPFAHLIPTHFSQGSKVWVYQASRPLLINEALTLEEVTENFVAHWKSHGTPVKGYANLLFGRFLVFINDEAITPISGCSTDSMVHIVTQLEQQLNLKFTDRTQLAFLRHDKIEPIPLNQLEYALANNIINGQTVFFNNMVTTKYDLLHNWQIPVSTSWISKRYSKHFETT